MPWHIGKSESCPSSKPYAVIKDSDGSVSGCHETEDKAKAQLAALHASESKEADMPEPMNYKEGAISFEEIESQRSAQESAMRVYELTDMFTYLVHNIYSDTTIDTQSALNRVVNEFQQRVEIAMNPNRKESKVPENLADTLPKEHKEDKNEFLVFKSQDGKWRWFAIYSNMYRDNDHPSEIISSKSHRAFTSLVDKGQFDYPELWHWHIEGSAWGKADWLAYADGFAMAAGYVYDGFEFAAKSLAEYDGDIRVSHGMPMANIVRDKNDPSIIVFHVTKEISPLPGWAAANKWTGFKLLKEADSMPIPDEKKEYLRTLGYSDDLIAQIEGGLQKTASALDQAGVESKEATEAEPEEPEMSEDETEEPDTDEFEDEAEETEDDKEISLKKEIAEVISNALAPMIQVLNAQSESLAKQAEEIASLRKDMSDLQATDAEKIAGLKENTPTRSLNEMIGANLFGASSRVDGRSKLANDGPKEKEREEPSITNISFLDGLIRKQRNGTPE